MHRSASYTCTPCSSYMQPVYKHKQHAYIYPYTYTYIHPYTYRARTPP